MPLPRTVTVATTNLWSAPSAPRDVDAAMLATEPDVAVWLGALDGVDDGRLGLHGRLLTQLVQGEPVLVEPGDADAGGSTTGWLRVVCPWQPSSLDPRGYPGWVVAAHLGTESDPGMPPAQPGSEGVLSDGIPGLLEAARALGLGLPYLWGGCCDLAVDCSSLVHLAARRLGHVVPRDADDQHRVCRPVATDHARPGDLLFFAHEGRPPHHVGIVSGPGRMLHAPGTGSVVVEEPLGPDRVATLLSAGRLRGQAA